MEQVGTHRGVRGHNGTIVARAMISASHSCPNPLQGFSRGSGGDGDKRDLKEDNERVLQMFTGSLSYVWGAAWKKHKGACVSTLATGWQSWHHSQQHGAWSWYHKGYLRGRSNSAKIILSKNNNLVYIKYASPMPHFASTIFSSCHWQFIRMLPLWCELTVFQ